MIDHVAVLVADLDEAKRFYADVLGWALEREAHMDEVGLDAAFFRPPEGGAMVELVHLTAAVLAEDLEGTVAALAEQGVETTTGIVEVGGRRTAFTRPETSGGVVYQLLEKPAA
jgi:predicted enzyme related to lactoylglutathione lyase